MVSLHNPSDGAQDYSFTLNRAFGLIPGSGPFLLSAPLDRYRRGLPRRYAWGDTVRLTLAPREIRVIDFVAGQEAP